jgi:DNA-binding XRE family transcriptional regulator
MNNPSPAEIKSTRLAAGLTQTEAANLVYVSLKGWQRWETEEALTTHRTMPAATWELFLMKTKEMRKEK